MQSRPVAAVRRRAFTLAEVMMAVGITVAIAALAMPLYTPLLSRQEFDTTVDAAVAQCEHARAEAQRRGMALELVVSAGGTRLEVRPVDLLADAEDDPEANDNAGGDGMTGALQGSAAARRLGAEMERRMERISQGAVRGHETEPLDWSEPWATLDLTGGVIAGLQQAEAEGEADAGSAGADADADAGSDADSNADADANDGTEGRIALFLPDGTAVAVRSCWFTCGARSARVDVDPLLGHASRHNAQR